MNWWMIAGGVLMSGAASEAVRAGNYNTAGVFLCYAVANVLLAFVKG